MNQFFLELNQPLNVVQNLDMAHHNQTPTGVKRPDKIITSNGH